MSNLGFHFLYHSLRGQPDLAVERFFLDTAPFTIETGARISSAAVLLFSVSYEEDFIGLVRILGYAGIAPAREERSGTPLVIAGGAAVSGNPVPLADIVDAAVLGEGEAPIGEIAQSFSEYRRSDPHLTLEKLAGVPGIYLPGSGEKQVRFASPAALGDSFPRSAIVSAKTVFSDTLLMEIGRGCPGSCGFCLARSLYGPFRHVPMECIARFVSSAPIPIERVGLVSTAVTAHPEFDSLVRFFTERGISVSFSSLRAGDLDDAAIETLSLTGTRSASLAPESGSEQVRYRLGKRIPDEAFFDAGARLARAGIRHFSLYLLVGCPGEGPESLSKTRRFLQRFKRSIDGRSCTVHVNIMVPKAWTPLQFYPMPVKNELEERVNQMRSMCKDLGLGIKTKTVRSAMRQAVLSLGDERVGRGIIRHVIDGVSWKKAMTVEGIDFSFPHEERGMAGSLPWDFIEGPASRDALAARYKRLALDID
jgi:radical SAM superfamily enzyme YgiQ (UPF0313 family)